jgi:hypothetical protein
MKFYVLTLIAGLLSLAASQAQQQIDQPIEQSGFLSLPGSIVSRPYLFGGNDACNTGACGANACAVPCGDPCAPGPRVACRTGCGWDWAKIQAWMCYKAAPASCENRPKPTTYCPPLYTFLRFREESVNMQQASCAAPACVSNFAPMAHAGPNVSMLPMAQMAPRPMAGMPATNHMQQTMNAGFVMGQGPSSVLPDRQRAMGTGFNPMMQMGGAVHAPMMPVQVQQPIMQPNVRNMPAAQLATPKPVNNIPGFQTIGGPYQTAPGNQLIPAMYQR